MVAVGLKLGQEFLVGDFLIFLTAANPTQGCVDSEPIEPGGELRMALEHMGFAEGGEKNILDHFFGVRGVAAKYAQCDVIQFARVEMEYSFERFVIAGLEALDQAGIRFGAFSALRQRARTNSSVLRRWPVQWYLADPGRNGEVRFARHKNFLVCYDRLAKASLSHFPDSPFAIVSNSVAMNGEQLMMRSFSLLMPIRPRAA